MAGWRRAAAAAYGLAARLAARRGPPLRLATARVISVGGLEAGGVGKTPCVLWWAGALAPHGRVAIVCRPVGAGAGTGNSDEVRWLEEQAPPGVVVVAGRHKAAAAERAARQGASLIVLDDGFSHRRLARDLDLVLVDARSPFANRRLLPAGPLREPPASLARATAVALTRADRATAGQIEAARRALREAGYRGPVLEARHRLLGLSRGGARRDPAGTRAYAVSSLGRPGELAEALVRAGAEVVASRDFPDHSLPSPKAWRAAQAAAAGAGAEIVITAKDRARLPLAWRGAAWVLEMEWEWLPGDEGEEWLVERALGARSRTTPIS